MLLFQTFKRGWFITFFLLFVCNSVNAENESLLSYPTSCKSLDAVHKKLPQAGVLNRALEQNLHNHFQDQGIVIGFKYSSNVLDRQVEIKLPDNYYQDVHSLHDSTIAIINENTKQGF